MQYVKCEAESRGESGRDKGKTIPTTLDDGKSPIRRRRRRLCCPRGAQQNLDDGNIWKHPREKM